MKSYYYLQTIVFFKVSLNKTSRACQRRVFYCIKNPQTALNVSVYLGEALQDKVN